MTDTQSAFDGFVIARGPALLRFAYLLSNDAALAEDLVQDALFKTYRRWARVAAADRPEAYVRAIVVNEFLSWRRRRSHAEIPALDIDTAQADQVEAFADLDQMWRLLGELPRRQRVVLVLRYFEALPDAEIATVLECAPATVRSLAARAFETLRHHPQLAGTPHITAEPITAEEER
jgi:RNA polymerase sigma-70 factor (sigma-E family)